MHDHRGRSGRPVPGDEKLFRSEPRRRDLIPFHEYFHGDNGHGLGAAHQTGWTSFVADLILRQEKLMTDLDVTLESLVAARTSVHGLAEQVFAAAARAATGSIRLYVRDGALSTPDLPRVGAPGRAEEPIRLQFDGGFVVRRPDGLTVPFHGPLGDLAQAMGVEFGLLDPPYPPASGCGPDHLVDADPRAVELILDAWRTGDAALRRFDADQQPIVWPEHLDVAIVSGAVNYGVSPGDTFEPRPYAYVGPHEPPTGPFWNAPFGAARRIDDLDGEDGVLSFFRAGRAEIVAGI